MQRRQLDEGIADTLVSGQLGSVLQSPQAIENSASDFEDLARIKSRETVEKVEVEADA